MNSLPGAELSVASDRAVMRPSSGAGEALSRAEAPMGVAGLTASVIGAYCCVNLYAALHCRGLYGDGAYYLLRIAEIERFHLHESQRKTVQILRQALVVALRRLTNLDLFQLGQAFSLSMLLLPAVLCALCWPILPRERKAWILFPVLGLLAGVSASSFAPIGEGAIAASYLWPLLFLFLFRTDCAVFQAVFLLLCIPAFFLHESGFMFMLVFLFACAEKFSAAATRRDHIFLVLCAILFASIIAYEIRWIIFPLNVVDRAAYFAGLRRLAFVMQDGRWNLPLVTGTMGLTILAAIAALRLQAKGRIAIIDARVAALIFICWALIAVVAAWVTDAAFSPFSQYQARNQAVFVGGILAAAAAWALYRRIPQQIWLQPATVAVIAALSLAQFSWDLAATERWRGYIADVRSRLASSTGLIGWEQNLASGDPTKNELWRLMGFGWAMPSLSVILQSGSPVRSMIAAPIGSPWQPFDPSNPDKLPKIRGVDYAPYVRAMRAAENRSISPYELPMPGH
jgi:hypothetical protein